MELKGLGLESQFISCEVEGDVTASEEEGGEEQGREEGEGRGMGDDSSTASKKKEGGGGVWEGVKRKYWSRDTYYLPIAVKQ